MTKSDLYQFVTNLLFGFNLDEGSASSLFDSFLDVAQDQIEIYRPWVILRSLDSSQTASPANNFLTPISLPTDFRRFYGDFPIVLTDPNGNPMGYNEIPLNQKFAYKDANGKFYVDYVAQKLFLCGKLTQGQTVNQFYMKKSPSVSATNSSVWAFDGYGSSFSRILGFLVALQYKGVDYDLVNLQNSGQLGDAAKKILDAMSLWDSEIQRGAQQGVDPFGNNFGLWSGSSGGGTMGIVTG